MPAPKSNPKNHARIPEQKVKQYDLLFPSPKGIPAIWFDQFSIEETRTHIVVRTGCSVGDYVYAFALSKTELKNQNFNFGHYVEQLRANVVDSEVTAAKVRRMPSSQSNTQPIHSIRFIRAGRVNNDGEIALYTFSTTTLLHPENDKKPATTSQIEAEAIIILHSDLNAHYSLVLELLAHTKEGLE